MASSINLAISLLLFFLPQSSKYCCRYSVMYFPQVSVQTGFCCSISISSRTLLISFVISDVHDPYFIFFFRTAPYWFQWLTASIFSSPFIRTILPETLTSNRVMICFEALDLFFPGCCFIVSFYMQQHFPWSTMLFRTSV